MAEDAPLAPESMPRGFSVRTRVLSTMLAFMVAGLVITGVLSYIVQFRTLEDRVVGELWQERSELEQVASVTDENGDLIHTDVDTLLRTVTEQAYPSDNESVLALLDGEPLYKPEEQDFELASPAVLDQIRAEFRPGRTVVTTLDVNGNEVRALIASVDVAGDEAQGAFVVASDVGVQKRELWHSAGIFTLLASATVIVAGLVGSMVTGRLLSPIATLRRTTEEITADELQTRVPVPDSRDDVAALAVNFNRMLERIQHGFAEQRRFMSDVGHELRTPLTIVRGTLEMTDVEDPADVRESHDIATEELDRMGRVVGDLSELAASARPDYVRPRPTDIAEFAQSAFARIEHVGSRTWVFEGAPHVVADIDEQRLVQAVVQLAANAVRYSEEGSTIRFGVSRAVMHGAGEIHVRLADEGVGIAPEDRENIFERFSTGQGSAARGGTGLGLPIVAAIAQGHGGRIELESEVGAGSTFTIVVPQQQRSGRARGEK